MLLKNARDRIVVEIGDQNIEVRLTNSAVISVRIDGQIVANPASRFFPRGLADAIAGMASEIWRIPLLARLRLLLGLVAIA